jgi:AcrR family transcriptional regulator
MCSKTNIPGLSLLEAYPAHRERQRKRILDAAEKLFVERGIDRVTMAELTAASGLQPSTMYQYFSKKDDIVWAIVGNIMAMGSR